MTERRPEAENKIRSVINIEFTKDRSSTLQRRDVLINHFYKISQYLTQNTIITGKNMCWIRTPKPP